MVGRLGVGRDWSTGEILGSKTEGSLEDWGQGRGCYINRQVLSQSREMELQGPGNTEQGD